MYPKRNLLIKKLIKAITSNIFILIILLYVCKCAKFRCNVRNIDEIMLLKLDNPTVRPNSIKNAPSINPIERVSVT